MKIKWISKLFITSLLLTDYNSLYAGQALWTYTPLTATTLTVASNTSESVQYTITNQSQKTLSLAMKPMTGIVQATSGIGLCGNPFTLSAHQSCTFKLTIDGSAIPAFTVGGPIVCQTNANGTPNANLCYQPSSIDQLNITRTSTPGSATLSSTMSALALSVNCPTPSAHCTFSNAALTGKPRIITVTNTSSTTTALNVAYSSPTMRMDTHITPTSCTILPLSSCEFTITPGETPSAAPGDTNATPIPLTIAGSNTNTVSTEISILTYGSVYQSGYLFAVDDTKSPDISIAGTVAALTDESPGISWQPGCNDSTNCTVTTANSYLLGAENTAAIVLAFTAPVSPYAAGLCNTYSSGGYSNWYLPAICEMGYGDDSDPFYPCGTVSDPTIQNMQSNLADNGIGNLSDSYWSSTQLTTDPLVYALYSLFSVGGFQPGDVKETPYLVRCVRNLSP